MAAVESDESENVGMKMIGSDKVWFSDENGTGFRLGRICELSEHGPMVQPNDSPETVVQVGYHAVYPAEDDDRKEVDDNCALMYLNEATLLHNVNLRYSKDKIYTYVANILIAVNPYFEIPSLYSRESIQSYRGKSLGTLPPHVFAVADKAYRDMKVVDLSQSIIVSGESGAGKTESTKYILKYLCNSYGNESGALEEKILQANPILEAFGNAKTTRNNNSSRFGKFIEIHFDGKHKVVGGYISHYLLERARVVSQAKQERNYHIFYQLCAGASDNLKTRLKLGPPDHFRYLAGGCTQFFQTKKNKDKLSADRLSDDQKKYGPLHDGFLDDYEDFMSVDADLRNIGLTDEDVINVYTTIAAVLHLGNIQFKDDVENTKGGCVVKDDESESSLHTTAELLELDPEELRGALTSRVMQSKSGSFGTVILIPLTSSDAANARDALAKALYSRLFDFIVARINMSIPFQEAKNYIGVLDIAGFEYFTVNSFEQFCINYCNEKLQQFFNQRILKDEQDLYAKEGLSVKNVDFVDNQDCIDLIEAKGNGIFSLLDEESKLPKPNHQHFTEQIHSMNSQHFRLSLPRKSRLKEHRELRDVEGFLIRHFAGAVCYQTVNFIDKNNDALHASLETLVTECNNGFIQNLFSSGKTDKGNRGKLNFISVGSKFKSQLSELMNKLRSTGTNFIRCIKPNVKMISHCFESGSVLSQLQCAGMTSVLELMQQGFPSRTQFLKLHDMYRDFMPADIQNLDPRLFCKALFKALGLSERDFQFGLTKAFFRPGKFAEFDQMLKSDPENLKYLVLKVKRWLICSRWRKVQWCALQVVKLKNKILYRRNALVCLQSYTRMYIAKKRHTHRYKGIRSLKNLMIQVEQIRCLATNLKNNEEDVEQSVQELISSIEQAKSQVKNSRNMDKPSVDSLYNSLVKRLEAGTNLVKKKIEEEKIFEEKERLRLLQEEIELEKKRRQAEAQEKKKTEEELAMKIEIERKRKEEEEEERRLVREERDKNQALALQKQLEEAESKYAALQKQIEQERRDHELALRLAAESRSGVEDVKREIPVEPSLQHLAVKKSTSKFDLSKWKYAELRDTINTSCDIELLEACREEFHRRLKVYHAWKAKNKRNSSSINENMRAPCVLTEDSQKTLPPKKASVSSIQRFFKIPFIRPEMESPILDPAHQSDKGWWYAHFDGQWIARQMELHDGRKPVLLLAGEDDMNMCELSLDETGLTRKRGAEIIQSDFEKEWNRHGGKSYMCSSERKKR